MRILFIFDTVAPYAGGSQIAVFNWIRNLTEMGIEVRILCDQNIFQLENNLKPTSYIINESKNLGKYFANFSLPLLLKKDSKRKIIEFNPDVIHLQEQSTISYQVVKFVKDIHKPVLTSYHGDYNNFKSNQFPLSLFIKKNGLINIGLAKLQTITLKNSGYLTAPTEYYQNFLMTRYKKKVYVLRNPISNYFFRPKKKIRSPEKLITFSRLSGEKNIPVLIEMMKYMKDKITLTIVGEGIDKEYLKNLVKKFAVDHLVTFVGWKNHTELPSLLNKHDLFVSCSNFESFGLTYIEALATHTPCIVYDYPVSREVIPSGTAIFIKNKNPKKWAQQIMNLHTNPLLFRQLEDNITKKYDEIMQYHEKTSTKELIQIYKNILDIA